jgi:hypothetical protein
MVHAEAQQLQSRLKNKLVVRQMSGDIFAYDGLGRVEAREVMGRNVAATFDDITHTRRKIARRRFVINLPIDASDVRGALLSPESEYARAVAAGMLRQYDRVAYEAAFADVLTGRDFGTTVTAATDGVVTVDATSEVEIHNAYAVDTTPTMSAGTVPIVSDGSAAAPTSLNALMAYYLKGTALPVDAWDILVSQGAQSMPGISTFSGVARAGISAVDSVPSANISRIDSV